MTDTTSRHGNAADYPLLARPHVQLHGPIDDSTYTSFQDQLKNASTNGPLVFAITTLGGDPEIARAMGHDVRLIREYTGRETLFLGKVAVYSAGATFMSFFPADKRFLTRGTRLMIHERQMTAQVALNGPLKMQVAPLKAKLHEIEHSIMIEEDGFRAMVAGTRVTFEEIREKAPYNWYINCDEALSLGLVLDVI